jgi:hypothetical protein
LNQAFGMVLATKRTIFHGPRRPMSAGAIESFAKLAGTLALLASFKIGRKGGSQRVRQRFARTTALARRTRLVDDRAPSPRPNCKRNYGRRHVGVSRVLVVLWLALLLFIVGYVTVRGPSALSDLDDAKVIKDY